MPRVSEIIVPCLLATTILAGAARAETMILAHGYAPTHHVVADGIVPWMACVEERTGGDITFQHFPSAQIASHEGAIDALNEGLAQVAAVITGYASEKLPLNGITLLPGLGTTAVEMVTAHRAVLDAGGPMAEEYAANGVVPLLVNLLPAYQIMSTNGPVDSLQKFTGLKTRTSAGSPSFMAQSLGATPVEMSTSDMYVAMQRGTVDATFLALSSAKTYSLPELVNATSSNGFFGSGGAVLSIDADTFGGLDPTRQTVLTDCGRVHEMALAEAVDAENEALKAEFAEGGMAVFEFSDDVLGELQEAMSTVSAAYVERIGARGLPAQQAIDVYRAALGQ